MKRYVVNIDGIEDQPSDKWSYNEYVYPISSPVDPTYSLDVPFTVLRNDSDQV